MSIWSSSTACLDLGKSISKKSAQQNHSSHRNTHNRNIHQYVSIKWNHFNVNLHFWYIHTYIINPIIEWYSNLERPLNNSSKENSLKLKIVKLTSNFHFHLTVLRQYNRLLPVIRQYDCFEANQFFHHFTCSLFDVCSNGNVNIRFYSYLENCCINNHTWAYVSLRAIKKN